MGYFYYMTALKPHLPTIKQYIDEDEFEAFETNLNLNRFSMMDMDQRAIIPYFGYKGPHGLNEYYSKTQTVGRLHLIKVPTLFLNAEDDPATTHSSTPSRSLRARATTSPSR